MGRAAPSKRRVADPVGRLRELLRAAAVDQFAGVMAEDLGAQLRAAVDAIVERGEPPAPLGEQLAKFRVGTERFDERGRQDRSRVVAHGLRICAGLAALSGPPKPRARKPAPPPEPPPAEVAIPARTAVSVLAGVGPKKAEKLAERGIRTLEDLLYLIPSGYEDRRRLRTLDDVEEGESVVVEATIKSFRQGWFRRRFNATMRLRQETPSGPVDFEARWFHPVGGLPQKVETGERILLAGPAKRFRGAWSMVHPELIEADARGPAIAVRYPNVEGFGAMTVRKLCRAALEHLSEEDWPEPLPPEVRERHGLPDLFTSLRALHMPGDEIEERALAELQAGRSPAHRRLAFEEFFFLQLALLRRRAEFQARPCAVAALGDAAPDREQIRVALPFEPTDAQWRAIAEIGDDLGSAHPMLRLLQGDVGSGKTAVAFAAAVAVIRAGAQVALMAPTEILAEQHFKTLSAWCERAGIRIALLTAATPRAQRATMLALLAGGKVDLVVGTHALIVGDVTFARLGLAVVDEQHRFGVEQRTLLRDKGEAPHLLVMTATPIPRSLALTAFGELDVSVLDELPPGRTPPETKVFYGARALVSARRQLCEAVAKGTRAFVVCPLVEASEVLDVSDVEATAAELAELMPKARIGIIHGRMPSRQKDEIMTAFRMGELDVLVATTVIEVGVDVPDANMILVEHAERFGLAQLHQLRGRVGRGAGTSTCLIHTASPRRSDAGERLRILEESSDGFVVAEHDLSLRGPGEVFGTRQAGVPRLRFASFAGEGVRLLVEARDAAAAVLAADPGLARARRLAAELEARTRRPVYSAESG